MNKILFYVKERERFENLWRKNQWWETFGHRPHHNRIIYIYHTLLTMSLIR